MSEQDEAALFDENTDSNKAAENKTVSYDAYLKLQKQYEALNKKMQLTKNSSENNEKPVISKVEEELQKKEELQKTIETEANYLTKIRELQESYKENELYKQTIELISSQKGISNLEKYQKIESEIVPRLISSEKNEDLKKNLEGVKSFGEYQKEVSRFKEYQAKLELAQNNRNFDPTNGESKNTLLMGLLKNKRLIKS